MIYKDRLKSLRESLGLTQESIGFIIGVDRKAYNHFETEYTIIPIKHLNVLANYFNVSIDYIFGFNNEKNYCISNSVINEEKAGEKLKAFRKERKITQSKLSDLLKIDRSTISNYESGKNIISTSCLYDICKTYNVSADYLLGKIDEPKYLN